MKNIKIHLDLVMINVGLVCAPNQTKLVFLMSLFPSKVTFQGFCIGIKKGVWERVYEKLLVLC